MAGRAFEPLSFDRTYDKALSYLYNLQKFGIKFGLSKTENLLRAFGDPHRNLSFVHVAGSNGKGSVAAMLTSIFSRAGYKVGLFTSPHLVDFRERFQINGRMIPRSQALKLIREIRGKTDEREPPTFFEFVTAMALLWFFREKVDLAVMETGLGGRLDATNVIRPLISIITNITLEHQDYLGRDLEKIAWEKAGIIKRGVPLVSGVTQPKIRKLFEDICRRRKAPFFLAGRDFRVRKTGEGGFSYFGLGIADCGKTREAGFVMPLSRDTKYASPDPSCNPRIFPPPQSAIRNPKLKGLQVALKGDHQIRNAGLVLAAVELLGKSFPVSEGQVRQGLARVTWPGRMELLREHPGVVLDGAHNPGAMKVLARTLPQTFPYRRLFLVFGMMKDKNIRQTLTAIAPLADRIFFTRAECDRSAEPEDIRRLWTARTNRSEVCPTIPSAIERALQSAHEEDLILVTGSLFVVGEARAWWEKAGPSFPL